jgi:diguanylate cyclase (GGDEF)-like protein/PAS domain S-box-containing protein
MAGSETGESLRRSENLKLALNGMPVGVSWARLSDQRIVFVNRKMTEILGYTLADLSDIETWIRELIPYAEDREMIQSRWMPSVQDCGEDEVSIPPVEVRILCKDGGIRTILQSGVVMPATGWVLATFVDITDRKRDELLLAAAERKARENEMIYRLLLDHSPEMIVLSSFDGSHRYVSPAVEALTGYTAEEYLEIPQSKLAHPDDLEAGRQVLEGLRAGKESHVVRYRAPQKWGGYRWMEAAISGYRDMEKGVITGYVATVRDISEQKEREEVLAARYRQLAEVAALDDLTGIANRRTFNHALAQESSRLSRATRDLSLLMLDVDHFKLFNDRYGHLAGDDCLRRIARALKDALSREADLVARFGGEEFVALLPSTEREGAEAIAWRVLESVRRLAIPHESSGHGIVTVSIGVTTWEAGLAVDRQQMIDHADRALYKAKEGGRNTFRVISHDAVLEMVGFS